MKILVTVQNKGGVGKTTVCRLISEYLARQGKRVLGIDLDSQCNFSRRFLTMDIDSTDPDGIMPPIHPEFEDDDVEWDGRSSSADIYFSGQVLPYPTNINGMQILPGNGSQLRSVELVRAEDVKDKVHDRLQLFLSQKDVQSLYDIVIIDTSPSKGPLTISAIRAATHIIIPTTMEPQTIEGLHGMLQLWRRETKKRKKGDELNIIGISFFGRDTWSERQGLKSSPKDVKFIFSVSKIRQRIGKQTLCGGLIISHRGHKVHREIF